MRRLPILCLGFTTLLGACAFDPAPQRTALLDECDPHEALPVLEDNRRFQDTCGSVENAAGSWRFAMRDGDGADNAGPSSEGPGGGGRGGDAPGSQGPGGDGGSQGPGGDGGEPDAGEGDGGDGGGPPV